MARVQYETRVSKTRVPLADLEVFCHIDLESYRLEFVKSKPKSIGLDFYRWRSRWQKKKNRRTEDQIGQEEEESNLEGRRKELRRKKKRFVCGMWRMGNSSFKYSISAWIFFHIRLSLHVTWVLETQVQPLNLSFRVSKC